MRRITTFLIIMSVISICIVSGASAKEMTVQVSKTQLRSSPSYYGTVVSSVNYADKLQIVSSKGSWVKATNPKNKTTGWVHISALTSKRLTPRSGGAYAPSSVSTGELSAAEKGFTEQVEQAYRQKHKDLDFSWVDRMEKINVTPQQSASFLKEGQVHPAEGGAQ